MKSVWITFLLTVFSIGFSKAQNAKKHLTIGDVVPAFSLTAQDGKVFNIADVIGKHVLVIYFYPGDETMICTKEACAFRDDFNDFTKAGALVIGINSATVESHRSFAKNHKLPFILLSDPGNKVLDQFGVKGTFFGTGRETFVVDLKGKIVYTYDSMMKGIAHANNALEAVKAIKK